MPINSMLTPLASAARKADGTLAVAGSFAGARATTAVAPAVINTPATIIATALACDHSIACITPLAMEMPGVAVAAALDSAAEIEPARCAGAGCNAVERIWGIAVGATVMPLAVKKARSLSSARSMRLRAAASERFRAARISSTLLP